MSSEAHSPHEHPAPHRDRVRVLELLGGLAAGPAAWVAQLVVGYGLSSYACYPSDQPYLRAPPPGWRGERPVLLAINLACLVVALAGLWLAHRNWRATRHEKPGGGHVLLATGEGRTRFLAGCGMLTAAGFALAILFDTAAVLGAPTCWDFG
jgi:hypothetical protein